MCIVAALVLGILAAPASAEELNVSGTWEAVYHCEAGGCAGSDFPATAMLSQAPGSTHVVSPPDVEGTLNGNVLTLEGGSNGYHFVEHVTISPDGKTWSGPLSDNNGTSGTDTATRVSGGGQGGEPPVTPPTGPSPRHPTATQLSCGYKPLTASDTCTATVRDSAASGPTTPTGAVTLTASGGTSGDGVFIAGSTCQLAGAGPPGQAACIIEYIPPTFGLTKLQSDYAGDATHAPSTTGAPPGTPKACPKSKSTTVTCADPTGPPGVCKAPGPIYPQCYQPTVIPTVCATGAIGTSCQPADNYTVACGSVGTGLPQCAAKSSSVPAQFCGPVGSGLPACTGANNPITVCSASGSGLSQCSFTSKVTGAELDANTGSGVVEVAVGCPATGASASRAGKRTGSYCEVNLAVEQYLIDLGRSLQKETQIFSQNYGRAAERYLAECECASQLSQPELFVEHNRTVASRRARLLVGENTTESRFRRAVPTTDETKAWVETLTEHGSGGSAYIGPEEIWRESLEIVAALDLSDALLRVIRENHGILSGSTMTGPQQGPPRNPDLSDGLDPQAQRPRTTPWRSLRKAQAATPLATRHLRIRPGQSVKVRLHLSHQAVRKLLQAAGKKAAVVPLRVATAYATKPRPAVHVIDFPVRIKR